ncbi:MAG: SDR family NAD(P)-dependent oxidoreductase [Flavobacteriales bacterium]|jgi:NAD(P)-dependent dehydrogenase (short-subunit alcohol dehydrogenase family)|nr:SDR family NAD(P)-dependent oxidoreductase [Flavobacteriales bacterium]
MQKAVLITGAGSGIGRATARRLDQDGYALLLAGRTAATLRETLGMLSSDNAHAILTVDVADRVAMNKGLSDLLSGDAIELVGVFANAGIGGHNAYDVEPGLDRWDEILSANLTGVYVTLMTCLPWLENAQAEVKHVVVTSSVLARFAVPGYAAYQASKSGLLGLVRALAVDWGDKHVLVNAICPGWVETDMARDSIARLAELQRVSYEECHSNQCAQLPTGRMSSPEEIAETVAWLMSGAQRSITGQALDINNGSWMG